MENFVQKVNEGLTPWITRLSNQRHIQAIKLGIITSMPLCIAGGILLVLALVYSKVNTTFDMTVIWMMYQFFLLFVFIFIAFEIGKQIALSYKVDKTMSGMLAALQGGILCVHLILQEGSIANGILQSFFPMLFVAILSSEVFRISHLWKCKSSSLPASVIDYINNLLPIVVSMILLILLVALPQVSWLYLNQVFFFFTQCFDTLLGVLIIITLTCLFWLFGIHGVAIISAIVRPFWMYMLFANSIAFMQGGVLPYCSGEGFYQWFIWIGGSGTTISLVLWMRYAAKSKHLRAIGKDTMLSSFFNINEPVVFGTPMALNPYMMIPFLGVPILAGIVNYMLIQTSFMNAPFLLTGWVFPAPIGALLATGGDLHVLLGILLTVLLSLIGYAPFFMAYDKKLQREENAS